VILIVWIGAMNILMMEDRVRSSPTQWNAMNIYVLARCTHAVMDNVFHGRLEWHFNDSRKQRVTVSTNAI
jgi:hypothetical protein